MRILDDDEIRQLHAAALSAGLAHSRDALMAGIDDTVALGITAAANVLAQMMIDLDALNKAGALPDGTVPLATWLANAAQLAGARAEAATFTNFVARTARGTRRQGVSLDEHASVYELTVLKDGQPMHRGTAWFLRRDLVVTAFHVVGSTVTGNWLTETNPAVEYRLATRDGALSLEPALCDPRADVAMLRPKRLPVSADILELADAPTPTGATFRVESCSAARDGHPTSLSGCIIDMRRVESSTALQLRIDQGTDGRWDEVSGSPVHVAQGIAGLITQVAAGTATGWAASAEAIRRLQWIHDAEDLVAACREILGSQYRADDDLCNLVVDLGWRDVESPLMRSAEFHVLVERISHRAAQGGPEGLTRLLEEIGKDRPMCGEVGILLERVRRRGRTGGGWVTSRARVVADILQRLDRGDCAGVALLEPLGFGARGIVEQVLARLREPTRGHLLAVRLVPDRRTQDGTRLYGALFRDLKRGLELDVGRPLPQEWVRLFPGPADVTEESFHDTVDDLLAGPLAKAARKLVLVIDGLARVPVDQLESWGRMLMRLAPGQNLKLLAWGGQELYDLCVGVGALQTFSAFHVLHRIVVPHLTAAEVRDLTAERIGGDSRAIGEEIFLETGGHPALVSELLEAHRAEGRWVTKEDLQARILATSHLLRLRRIVELDERLREVLREITRGSSRRRNRDAERRLEWLGVLKDAGPKEWTWTAPVLRRWAAELLP